MNKVVGELVAAAAEAVEDLSCDLVIPAGRALLLLLFFLPSPVSVDAPEIRIDFLPLNDLL